MSSNSTISGLPLTAADSSYGYLPAFGVCVTFVVLFGISTGLYTNFTSWTSYLLSFMVYVFADDAFLIQIVTTIIAPTFMSAANFVILGAIINRLGYQYSRLSAKYYAIVFIVVDVAALIVQSIGGAKAEQAAQNNGDPDVGGRIMLGGILVQLVGITIYTAVASEFFYRFHIHRPFVRATKTDSQSTLNVQSSPTPAAKGQFKHLDKKMQLMIVALGINTLFLMIRSIYRSIELADGWEGHVIKNQLYFNVLDGMPITIVMWTFNIFHPGFLLPTVPAKCDEEKDVEKFTPLPSNLTA